MNRLNQTEPATFSIMPCWAFLRDSVFLYSTNGRIKSGFNKSNFQPKFTGVMIIIISYSHRHHVPLCCKKWLPELKMQNNLVWPPEVKLLVGFRPNL
jgi:hypothetical protein